MTLLVTDIPVWADCPFRDQVPGWIEIRREGGVICLRSPAHELHVSLEVSYKGGHGERFTHVYGPMVNAMVEAALEAEFTAPRIWQFRRFVGAAPPDPALDAEIEKRFSELQSIAAPLRAASGAGPGIPRDPA